MYFPRILRFWRFFSSVNSSFQRTKVTIFQSIWKWHLGFYSVQTVVFFLFHRLPSFGRVWNQGPRWQSRYISFSSAHSVIYCKPPEHPLGPESRSAPSFDSVTLARVAVKKTCTFTANSLPSVFVAFPWTLAVQKTRLTPNHELLFSSFRHDYRRENKVKKSKKGLISWNVL